MLAQFKKFIERESLFNPTKDQVVLATSGGIDSVVMANLFAAAGYRFALAHCNFKLRGKESEEDALFVQKLAQDLNVPYYYVEFDTLEEAKSAGESIQMVARSLRYNWLHKLCKQQNFTYMATAHHTNDSIETAIFNLTKGCGIRGLHGILPKKGKLIRPLLFASKNGIRAYAKTKGLAHREDSSNASLKYTRNKIRQEVIPKLQEINPTLENTFKANFKRFKEVEYLYEQAIEQLKSTICKQKGGQLIINRGLLNECATAYSLLHELLTPLGFNQDQINDLIRQPKAEAGGIFSSKTHRLVRTDVDLVVEAIPKKLKEKEVFKIESIYGYSNRPWRNPNCDISLSIELIEHTPETHHKLEDKDDPFVAILGLKQVNAPLYLRKWREGDTFQPLGMKGKHKKVNKLFKDKKINRFDREKIWILTDANDVIMWVVGLRQDERFVEWGQYIYKIKATKL